MKFFFFLIKILVVYLFLISSGLSKESSYLSKGIELFQKEKFDTGERTGFPERLADYIKNNSITAELLHKIYNKADIAESIINICNLSLLVQ